MGLLLVFESTLDFKDSIVFKSPKYWQSIDNGNNWIVGNGFQLQFYLEQSPQDLELRFQLFDKTLKHLMTLYEKNIVIKNLKISNIYVLSKPLDILITQLGDYTEAKEDLKTYNKTMETILEMASQLFPGVVEEINVDRNSSDKSKGISKKSFVIKLSDDEKKRYFDQKEVIEGKDDIFKFLKEKLLSGKINGDKWYKVELFKIDTAFFFSQKKLLTDWQSPSTN